jgi:hypothetical protein
MTPPPEASWRPGKLLGFFQCFGLGLSHRAQLYAKEDRKSSPSHHSTDRRAERSAREVRRRRLHGELKRALVANIIIVFR